MPNIGRILKIRAYARQGTGYRDKLLAGTVGYAAPEQLDMETGREGYREGYSDERSDIYAFGATLYHMLTGHDPSMPPYGVRPIRRMNPALSTGMEQLIERCTMTQPAMRFQTAEEIKKELERLEKHSGSIFWNGRRKFCDRLGRGSVIKRLERKIWLTQKQGCGLLGLWLMLSGIFAAGALFVLSQLSVISGETESDYLTDTGSKGVEMLLPVIVYNDLGQKILIRKGSVYQPQGSLILELNQEIFAWKHLQMVSVSLTDCHTGARQERIFYIRGRTN